MHTSLGRKNAQTSCAVLAWALACFNTTAFAADTVTNRLTPPVVAAHRGGYFEPGNALKKVQATLDGGAAQVLEIDLRLTLDGVVVVSHDAAISGRGACIGEVETFTFAALTACDFAINGEPATRFEDVLDVVDGRAVVNAEFKTQAVIAPAIGIVAARQAKSWVYFQATGDFSKYQLARGIDADISLLLKVTSDDEIEQAIALHDPHLVILEMDRDFVTPQRISRIHAANMLVSENSFRYQFTEERFIASCDRVFRLGVDIAVSNNASRCAAQRGMWQKGPRRFSNPLDRQHLRTAFRGHKHALELFLGGIATLGIALLI